MTIRILYCLVGCVVLGNVSFVHSDDTIDEAAAARRVRLLGGKVVRKSNTESGPVVAVNLERNDRFTEKYIHLLAGFPSVESVSFFQGCLTDTGLKNLKLSATVTALDIGGCPKVTDIGAKEICRFENLQSLSLRETQITDATILELKKLKHLTELNLYGCQNITDGCAATLGEMTQLTSLNLNRTNITTASVKDLANLKQLKTLKLLCKRISPTSVEELKKQLPIANIEFTISVGDVSAGLPGESPKIKRPRRLELYDSVELPKRLSDEGQ